ncbi:hypothetical protein LCGC14_2171200 [marine sediment metagenome]|uniref:HTH luxR-type domain-containing protein n=1 Tax=marine sediment metagenome TaxID=412755 RepID=A0A0F9DQ70_9ZZZZ
MKWIPKVGAKLSTNERKVLVQMALGYKDIEIAPRLGITSLTVKEHRLRIRRKLGTRNSTHAMALAFKKGIIEWGKKD